MVFDLREEAPATPAERRQGRYTVLICTGLAVALFAMCLGGIGFLRWRSHHAAAAARAQGESFMSAIVLPDPWRRDPVAYHERELFYHSESWDQKITTDTADLAAAQANLSSAVHAAGWTLEEHCGTATESYPEIDCRWLTDGYRLRSSAQLDTALSAPCPPKCVKVTLTVEPYVPPRRTG